MCKSCCHLISALALVLITITVVPWLPSCDGKRQGWRPATITKTSLSPYYIQFHSIHFLIVHGLSIAIDTSFNNTTCPTHFTLLSPPCYGCHCHLTMLAPDPFHHILLPQSLPFSTIRPPCCHDHCCLCPVSTISLHWSMPYVLARNCFLTITSLYYWF